MAIRTSGDLRTMTEAKRAVLVFLAIAYAFSVVLSLLTDLTGDIEADGSGSDTVDAVSRGLGVHYKRGDTRRAALDRMGPISL